LLENTLKLYIFILKKLFLTSTHQNILKKTHLVARHPDNTRVQTQGMHHGSMAVIHSAKSEDLTFLDSI
jgi:hypothetical protein